ncbi:hypothetical protein D3C76_1549960 [compost metagenome]
MSLIRIFQLLELGRRHAKFLFEAFTEVTRIAETYGFRHGCQLQISILQKFFGFLHTGIHDVIQNRVSRFFAEHPAQITGIDKYSGCNVLNG